MSPQHNRVIGSPSIPGNLLRPLPYAGAYHVGDQVLSEGDQPLLADMGNYEKLLAECDPDVMFQAVDEEDTSNQPLPLDKYVMTQLLHK